jgi:PAS domain S-box-containing protein
VDDDENLLEIVKLFLEETKYITVDTAISAEDALNKLRSTSYDAIVSDYEMPKMNGIEFLKQVRRTHGDLPFILFTGRGREEVVIQAINNGADFYLQKGGEPESQFAELSHKIRQAVQRRMAEAGIRNYERREADILNFLPDATFAIDTHGVVIAWNRAIEEMTGVTAPEMIGKGNFEYAIPFYSERRPMLIDLIFESDDTIARKYYNIFQKKGDVLIAETNLTRPLGRQAILWGKGSPLYDNKGTIIGAIESIRDITDRRRSEEELRAAYEQLAAAGQQLKSQLDELVQREQGSRQSDERFRQIAENAGEWIWETDTEGLFTYSSPVVEKILGYAPDEFIGRIPFFDLLVPEERETITKGALRANADTLSFKGIQHQYLHKDGTCVFLETSCVPIPDEQGNFAGYRGVSTDITERKRQEDILRSQLDLGLALQTVAGMDNALETCLSAAIGLSGMDSGGIYLVDETTGSVDLALSKNLGDEFVRSVSHYPADSVNAKMVLGGKPLYVLYRQAGVALSSVDEKEGLQVCAVIPIISGSRVIACMNVASHTLEEITETARVALETIATQIGTALDKIRSDEALAESEQKYRNVVEDQTEFISRFLPDGTHIFVNDAYCRYFNKTRKELIGHRFVPVIPPEDRHIVRNHFRALTPQNPVATIVHRVILPDGSIRWHRWSDRAIFDENNVPTEYQSVGRDFTNIKQAEGLLRKREAELRSMLNATPVGVALLVNRVFQRVNQSLCKMTGFSENEMIGQSTRILYTDDAAYLKVGRDIYDQIDRSGFGTGEARLRKKDGTNIDVILTLSPFDPANLAAGVTATVMDITDSKKAEETLHQQNLVLKTINQLALEFSSLPRDKSVPEQAVKTLMKLSGAILTLFSVYDPSDRTLQATNFEIAPGMLEKIIPLLGKRPGEVKTTVSTDMYQEMVSTIIGKRKTLTEVSFGQIPPLVSTSIQKMMNIDRFIAIAYVIEGKLYGTSLLAMKPGQPDPPTELLESFAHIVAVSLRRHRMEATLNESEEFLMLALEGAELGTRDWNIASGAIVFNERWAGMLGYTVDEILPAISSWERHVHPDDLPKVQQVLQDNLDGKSPVYEIEYRLLMKNRDWLWVLDKGKVIERDARGRPLRAAFASLDISERKRAEEALRESEEKYRLLTEVTDDVIYMIDMRGMVTHISPQISRYGYKPEEIISRKFTEFLAEEDIPNVMADFEKTVSTRQPSVRTLRIRDKGGDLHWMEDNGAPVFNTSESVVAVSGILRDISKRRHAEEALRQVNCQLNLMTSITRHDILNKIMTLLSYLALIKKKPQSPEIQTFMDKMESVMKEMKSQIEFTRIYQDLGTHEPQWQDVGKIVTGLEIPSSISLQSALQEVEIYADPLLKKVFYNLLDNTVRHGISATRIRISCRQAPQGLVLVNEDNGAGISSSDKDQIFERGFGKNNGLGLFLVKEILAITGISIRETGREGEGARFEILVPEGKYRFVAGS